MPPKQPSASETQEIWRKPTLPPSEIVVEIEPVPRIVLTVEKLADGGPDCVFTEVESALAL